MTVGELAGVAWLGVMGYMVLALLAQRFKAPPRIGRNEEPTVIDLRRWKR